MNLVVSCQFLDFSRPGYKSGFVIGRSKSEFLLRKGQIDRVETRTVGRTGCGPAAGEYFTNLKREILSGTGQRQAFDGTSVPWSDLLVLQPAY